MDKTAHYQSSKQVRIPAIDVARGVALVAMAIFHFGWDLESFGIARPGMTLEAHWKYFARTIAASFLVLVGLSAWLAHRNGLAAYSFVKRIILVGGSALIITIATYFATPGGFIFFGILHNITLSSVLVLVFLRLPLVVVTAFSALVLSAPYWARTPVLDGPIWWWSGLSQTIPRANDYVPIFPWFGWVLAGLALAKLFCAFDIWQKLAQFECNGTAHNILRFFGRNSLIFYLAHQPVLIGILYIVVKFTA